MTINPDGITRYHESPAPLLSVLICTLPRRAEMLAILLAKLDAQKHSAVEVLVASDDGTLSIGAKRQLLIDGAQGKYIAFVDDDDGIADEYFQAVSDAAQGDSDVITFKQHATMNGTKPFIVTASLSNPSNEPLRIVGGCYADIKRRPWHWCAWKRELVNREKFEDISYGEDWHWCEKVLHHCHAETHIDKVLHYYVYSHKTSVSDERRDTGTVKRRVEGMGPPILPDYSAPNIFVEEIGKAPAAPAPKAIKTRFVLKYPTRNRPGLFQDCVKSWTGLASGNHPIRWIVSLDDDDLACNPVREWCISCGIESFVSKRTNKIGACNRDMPSPDTFDIVVLISDDMMPDCKDWDEFIATDMNQQFPDYSGALWYPDGRQNRINCFEVQGREWYRKHGYLYCPDYVTEFSDNEATEVGLRDGKLARIQRRLVRHEWIGHKPDELFRENCRDRGRDQQVYERRKAAGFP